MGGGSFRSKILMPGVYFARSLMLKYGEMISIRCVCSLRYIRIGVSCKRFQEERSECWDSHWWTSHGQLHYVTKTNRWTRRSPRTCQQGRVNTNTVKTRQIPHLSGKIIMYSFFGESDFPSKSHAGVIENLRAKKITKMTLNWPSHTTRALPKYCLSKRTRFKIW